MRLKRATAFLSRRCQFIGSIFLSLLVWAIWAGRSAAQTVTGEWAQMTLGAAQGVYGTQGVASPQNVPGPREDAATWVDGRGNFWLFGGFGSFGGGPSGELNDLWMFDPSIEQWTWVGGSASGYQNPVYGTVGTAAGNNIPGERQTAVSESDGKGDFWLIGGWGVDSNGATGPLNDVWMFDPSIGQWAWMGGSNTYGQAGTYGTLGTAAAGNIPGARSDAAGWRDKSGNIWIFGGVGVDQAGRRGYLNDLWEFQPVTRQWTWMGGKAALPSAMDSGWPGVYGTEGAKAAANQPGSREDATSWTDSNGNLWLFGGTGFDESGTYGLLNDLWELDAESGEWTWVSGSSEIPVSCPPNFTCVPSGVYGTLGTPGPANTPGGRLAATAWRDPDGGLWLFGGYFEQLVSASTEVAGAYQDLWRFDTFTREWTWMGGPNTLGQDPVSGQLGVPAATNIPAGAFGAPSWTGQNGNFWILSQGLWQYELSVTAPAALPTFSVAGGTYTSAQTVAISDATAGATIYYTTDGTTPTSSSTVYSGAISVSTSETLNAIAVASGYSASAVASATYTINLPPATFTLGAAPASLSVSGGGTGTTTLTVTPQNGFNAAVSFACSGLPLGATCAFSPAMVTPSGSAATTTLTITAPAKSAAVKPGIRPELPMLAVAVVGFLGWRRRRRSFFLLMMGLVVLAGGLVTACGGGGGGAGGGGGGGGSTTSMVTVTATSGSLQQTATISLTVN